MSIYGKQGLVLLCSAFAEGSGLRLELDADGDAWDVQYRQRFAHKQSPQTTTAPARPPIHYKRKDAVSFLENSYSRPAAEAAEGSVE
eukprot:scaffold37945_cov33-Tisochrysis_lutea.AAC.2